MKCFECGEEACCSEKHYVDYIRTVTYYYCKKCFSVIK